MRIAILSDTHGNWPALAAVLADLEREPYDRLVFLGDAAALGPQPAETIEAIEALACPCIMGNTDEMLLQPLESMPQLDKNQTLREQFAWGQAQLSSAHRDFLASFQPTLLLPFAEGEARPPAGGVLCVHGSPQSNVDVILATTPGDDLEEMLSGARGPVMAGGHTHTQLFRRYKDWILYNPGSIGLPVESHSGRPHRPPWAEYGFITYDNGRLTTEHRRVPLDAGAVRAAAARSSMPHAGEWIAAWE